MMFAWPSRPGRSATMPASLAAMLLIWLLVATTRAGSAAQSGGHPMDPLSPEEYSAVVRALNEEGYVDRTALYPLITLEEPSKQDVLAWSPEDPASRRAFAIVKKGPQTFEAVVDTVEASVVTWTEVEDVQPGLLPTVEWSLAQIIVQASREWQAVVRSRGIEDLRDVVCVPNTAGFFGIEEEKGRRLVKVACYAPSGAANYWGRPIEGLTAVVDLDRRELIELIDSGPVPIPTGAVDLDEASVGDLREAPNPISFVQPGGPTYQVDGHEVRWQKWHFHYRIDPRLGPVVSVVTYDDGGKDRSVLYQGSLSEIFIPYMDPDVGWFFRTYLDAGEYGVGRLSVALQLGLDCPSNARFFDATFAQDTGEPYTQPNAACIFERYAGDIAWRHYEAVTGEDEVRPRTDLVVRNIAVIGNYDYIFDWVFRQDGTIEVDIGATGVPQVKAVGGSDAADDDLDSAYGHLVAERTVAINHDHFFSFRMDLDVDGPVNRLRPRSAETAASRVRRWQEERVGGRLDHGAERVGCEVHAGHPEPGPLAGREPRCPRASRARCRL